jgi:hypothetical protein
MTTNINGGQLVLYAVAAAAIGGTACSADGVDSLSRRGARSGSVACA